VLLIGDTRRAHVNDRGQNPSAEALVAIATTSRGLNIFALPRVYRFDARTHRTPLDARPWSKRLGTPRAMMVRRRGWVSENAPRIPKH
jgi:hypothetical protein